MKKVIRRILAVLPAVVMQGLWIWLLFSWLAPYATVLSWVLTVFAVVLPSAVPGILAGVILGIGRIVGETAALIYTAGTVAALPTNVMSSGRTLAVHMYVLASEGLYMKQAYATAVVLVLIVIGINAASAKMAKKLMKGN